LPLESSSSLRFHPFQLPFAPVPLTHTSFSSPPFSPTRSSFALPALLLLLPRNLDPVTSLDNPPIMHSVGTTLVFSACEEQSISFFTEAARKDTAAAK
jgi:hypothetical protein